MNRVLLTVVSVFVGLFSLIVGLILTPFLALAAFLTGKKIKQQMEQAGLNQGFRAYRAEAGSPFTARSTVIEGEYEEVKAK